MIEFFKFLLDLLVPRFVVENMAFEKDIEGNLHQICREVDLEPFEPYDEILPVRAFNFFGFGLFPKVLEKSPAGDNEAMYRQEELFFVGYTNGAQVLYASEDEGSFYKDTDCDCCIPLYMLKTHEHRLEGKLTSGLDFETVLKVRDKSKRQSVTNNAEV